jgi:hypothetical protein
MELAVVHEITKCWIVTASSHGAATDPVQTGGLLVVNSSVARHHCFAVGETSPPVDWEGRRRTRSSLVVKRKTVCTAAAAVH